MPVLPPAASLAQGRCIKKYRLGSVGGITGMHVEYDQVGRGSLSVRHVKSAASG